jgi:hypothetical protein
VEGAVSCEELIPFVDAWCDRWCERCPLTARCRAFATERVPVEEAIERARERAEDVADDDGEELPMPSEEELEEIARLMRVARRRQRRDPIERAAFGYVRLVGAWDRTFDGPPREGALGEALETIERDSGVIAAKLHRALDFMDDPAVTRADPESDENGSAKVALLSIDRSLAAWTIVLEAYPAARGTTRDARPRLERLRHAVEAEFPLARGFRRPGFDVGAAG